MSISLLFFLFFFFSLHSLQLICTPSGMNVLAAPFLYTMPSEVEAFNSFNRFIEFCCPLYVQPTLEGVHRGLKVGYVVLQFIGSTDGLSQLLDKCLEAVDKPLFQHLRSKNLQAEIYAFPCMCTVI